MDDDERVLRMATLDAGITVILDQLKRAAGDMIALCGDDPIFSKRKQRAQVIRAFTISLDSLDEVVDEHERRRHRNGL